MLGALGYAYGASGNRSEAEKVLAKLMEQSKKQYVSPFYVAIVYLGLAENDKAVDWLEKAYMDRSNAIVFSKVDPQFGRFAFHASFPVSPASASLQNQTGHPPVVQASLLEEAEHKIHENMSFLNVAVNRFALPNDTVFVRDRRIPALFVRHVSQQHFVALAVSVHVHSQIPSRHDFWRVREVRVGELLPMHCDELTKIFCMMRYKGLPRCVRAVSRVLNCFGCVNCPQEADCKLAS
jgi:hypothetical protein